MANIARVDILRIIQEGSITTSYTDLGSSFGHPMRILNFKNNTDGIIYVSFDGVNDNLDFPPHTFQLYDLTSDQDFDEKFRFSTGTQIFVKYVGTAPTTGYFSLSAIYGMGE